MKQNSSKTTIVFNSKISKYIILLVGAVITIIAAYHIGINIFSQTIKTEVIEIVNWTHEPRTRYHSEKYHISYLIKYENKDGTIQENIFTKTTSSLSLYKPGTITKVDILPNGKITDHVYFTEILPILLLEIFGLFLFYIGLMGKIKKDTNAP